MAASSQKKMHLGNSLSTELAELIKRAEIAENAVTCVCK